MDSIKEYKSIVRFEKALDIVASSMTQDVTFEVKRIEFVYSQFPHITAEGYVQTDDGRPTDVSLVWKFELYNPNDDKYYRCYVSAVDATFTYMVTLQA